MQIHVHYFEDGNLQLQSSKIIPSSVLVFKSESELIEQVMRVIQVYIPIYYYNIFYNI